MPKQKRDEMIWAAVTAEEKAEVQEYAERKGYSLSAVVRHFTLKQIRYWNKREEREAKKQEATDRPDDAEDIIQKMWG